MRDLQGKSIFLTTDEKYPHLFVITYLFLHSHEKI